GLPQAEHDRRLGVYAGGVALEVLQHAERLAVGRAAVAHGGGQALHRLHVVGDDVGERFGDGVQVALHALEVGDEHLHAGAGGFAAQGADGGGEVGGAAVRAVVPVHRGDDDVLEAEIADRAGQVLRLL